MNYDINQNSIYFKVLSNLMKKSNIDLDDKILVVCGGSRDKEYFEHFGFKNVTISNLDDRMYSNEFAPFNYSYQNAESLTFKDNEYDWVFVHAGLHHCYRPHIALLEMIRVGKKGAAIMEARDSFVMKLGQKLKLVPTYEIEAIIGHDLKYGGVANSFIPNYIYRWTEAEIEKITYSLLPQYKDNKIDYIYNLRLPIERVNLNKSALKKILIRSTFIPLRIFSKLFPKQSNEFGFVINKGQQTQDWLQLRNNELEINKEYLEKHFDLDYRVPECRPSS